ncbi:MAG: hypothetical protein KH050_10750 [Clostridiaceae bacterium]|nr:hypothetical protein [Clostridiaceae bacterium]
MNTLLGCFLLGLARLSRRAGLLLVLLPLTILTGGLLFPADRSDQPLEAGVCLPEHSPGAQALFRALSETDPAFVVFHEASEEIIRSEVAAGRWECGFILHEDFETRYPEQYPGKLATVVRSRSGTLSPLLGEAFSAALYHVRAPYLAADYAAENGLASDESLDALTEQVAAGSARRMALTVQTVDGTAQTAPSLARSTARALCRGLIAVTLFLYALLLAADLNACMSEGWFTRTAALTGRLPLLCGPVAAQMGAASVSALIAFGLGAWFFGGADVTGFAAIVLYALMLTGLALTLAQLPAAHGWLTALLPFVPAVCLVLCPILFDAGQFFPPAAPVSAILPPTWLLHVMNGHSIIFLPAAALFFALAAAVLSRQKLPLN